MSGLDLNAPEITQRLVAILAADAVGYSRLMAADAHSTVAALDAARAVFRHEIESRRGRVVDMAGDSDEQPSTPTSPRNYPGITQEVAPNQSQRAPKAMT